MEMKNKTIILIVVVNLAALVMLAVFFPHLMVSPGKPIDAHADIAADCFACHTQARWTPATFEHDKYLRFDKHHRTDCETCHVENDYGNYTCYGCHEHSRRKIRKEHVEEGIYDYEVCVECHRSGDEDEAERIWRTRRMKRG